MKFRKVYIVFLILLIVSSHFYCLKSTKPGIPEPVRRVIDLSGINRTEFLKALVQYQKPEDSLKLQALYYLISNMGSHYYVGYKIIDSLGNEFKFSFNNYSDYEMFNYYYNLLNRVKGKLKVVVDTFVMDIYTIESEFLLKTVDDSYEVWQNKLFTGKKYSFETYCEYILPYRVDNEKIEDFHSFFRHKYQKDFFKFKKDSVDFVTLVSRIHLHIKDKIKPDKRFDAQYYLPTLNELSTTGYGNKRYISIYEIKALRAFGIASSMDYTPYYADSSGGNFWVVVILPDGVSIPLFLSEKFKNEVFYEGRVPKVFRRTYYDDSTTLFRIKDLKVHTPPFLGDFNYKDVTDYYITTSDITVKFKRLESFVYLSVFNNGRWHPVFWSVPKSDSSAVFKKMGRSIVYLPVVIINNEVKEAGEPFFVDETGKKTLFSNEKINRIVVISNVNSSETLEKNEIYNVFRWEGSWKLYDTQSSGNRGLIKIHLERNGLFLVSVEKNIDDFTNERIFTFGDAGNQIFH
jgi:hypothetical protein